MIWDLLSLIDSCSDYNVSQYAEDSRFKDFLRKYDISSSNIPARINEIVTRYSRGGPGKKQLIRKEKTTGKEKKYIITEEGHKVIKNWDYKRLADDFTLIFMKASFLEILDELEDLRENFYIKNHYNKSNIHSVIKKVNDFAGDVDLDIVSRASHYHSPLKNYFQGLEQDLPINDFFGFLKPLLEQHDTYYTFNLIRQLYYHNSDYLRSLLTQENVQLEKMMDSLDEEMKLSISLLLHYYYVIFDLDIPSFIENTLFKLKEYFSEGNLSYLSELLSKASNQEAMRYLDSFFKHFDPMFIGKFNLSNLSGFLSVLLEKNSEIIAQIFSSIIENFDQYTTNDLLSFLNYLIIQDVTPYFYHFENYQFILEHLIQYLPLKFYNLLDKVIIYNEESEKVNISLENKAIDRILRTSRTEFIDLFTSANSSELKSNSFLFNVIKQINLDFITDLVKKLEEFPLIYIINVLYRVNRESAKKLFSIIDRNRFQSILLNEDSLHNLRVFFLVIKRLDPNEVNLLFRQNLSHIKTLIFNDTQRNFWILYDFYQMDPDLVIKLINEILMKISEEEDFPCKVKDIYEHCKPLFDEIRDFIEELYSRTNRFPILLEYPFFEILDSWSNEVLLELLNISIINERIPKIEEISEILGEDWNSEKLVFTQELIDNIANFVINSLEAHSYKIAFHDLYYKLTSVFKKENPELFTKLRTKMRLNELDYVLPYLAW